MALGNANNSAQSRGKNKPVIVKRRKEVVLAKSYTAITGSTNQGAVTGSVACAVDNSDVNLTYYHNNTGQDCPTAGSKVYSRPRANDRFLLTDGMYKVLCGSTYYALEIQSSLVRTIRACK
jgi:hypothetical protein|tara:strand:+ start:406 stop:768 length:363 start_codon:yes stop_codon:yes gene_type:complete